MKSDRHYSAREYSGSMYMESLKAARAFRERCWKQFWQFDLPILLAASLSPLVLTWAFLHWMLH